MSLALSGCIAYWIPVFRAGSDDIENIERLQRRVRDGVSKLKGLGIGDELGVEILAQLIESRMTVSEIVERAYHLTVYDEGFQSSYSKVSREIRKLESKGYVSRSLFGKEKPYRLTDLAVTNLARIGGGEKEVSMIPMIDLAFYLATMGSSLLVAALAMGMYELSELGTLGLFGGFCLLLGVSLSRFVQAFRRVF